MPPLDHMVTSRAHLKGVVFFIAHYEQEMMTAAMPSSVRKRLMICCNGKPGADEEGDPLQDELSCDELDVEEGSEAARASAKPVKRRYVKVSEPVDARMTTSLTKWKVCSVSILF
jgi:hypothetical protein